MNPGVRRFYIVNQLLCGVPVEKLTPDAIAELDSCGLKARYVELLKRPDLELDKVQQTFINFLRLRQYDYCLCSESRRVLTLREVSRLVREMDLKPADVAHWASSCFREIRSLKSGAPYIQDGIGYFPEEFLYGKYDLDGEMRHMFAIYCWGCDNPPPAVKEFVCDWIKLFTPGMATNCTEDWLREQFDRLCAYEFSPQVLGNTVLCASDLNSVLGLCEVVAQYSSPAAESVLLLVPGKTGSRVICAELLETEFIRCCGVNGRGLASATVQKGKLITGGVDRETSRS